MVDVCRLSPLLTPDRPVVAVKEAEVAGGQGRERNWLCKEIARHCVCVCVRVGGGGITEVGSRIK